MIAIKVRANISLFRPAASDSAAASAFGALWRRPSAPPGTRQEQKFIDSLFTQRSGRREKATFAAELISKAYGSHYNGEFRLQGTDGNL